RQALAIFARLADDFPDLPVEQKGRAPIPGKLARDLSPFSRPHLLGPGNLRDTHLLTMLEADPIPRDYRAILATCHNDLGILFTTVKRFPEAEKGYRQARSLFEKLAAGSPDFPEYRHKFVTCCRNLASVLSGDHCLKEKEQLLRQGLTLQDKLVT